MEPFIQGIGPYLAVPLALVSAYPVLYLFFRLRGVLRVNREGWHAGAVVVGRRLVMPALRLFEAFHPLMRLEAKLRRRFGKRNGKAKKDKAVSDVVVELVRMA